MPKRFSLVRRTPKLVNSSKKGGVHIKDNFVFTRPPTIQKTDKVPKKFFISTYQFLLKLSHHGALIILIENLYMLKTSIKTP